ncbi:MAG: AbrB/MazE/SpoVT family DNA-binding domain-containing protein [Dehalococcoidia bacterium]|nr:AbrB/MazE/SpoVT family DNA-binding domain-containing protein [Dehalococcoidia bacterium]
MKISERGQITIPKHLRERYGMTNNVEVEITPTEKGLLIQKSTAAEHPVDRIVGILDGVVDDDLDIDEYIEEIRGR